LVPTAVLLIPVPGMTLSSAFSPTAVFPPPGQSLGHCALSDGESANQASPIASVKKPQRKGERLLDLIRFFISFVIWFEVALLNARTALQFARSQNHPKKCDPP
jgi:hypothetical protein